MKKLAPQRIKGSISARANFEKVFGVKDCFSIKIVPIN
jgi:hypothetical protein